MNDMLHNLAIKNIVTGVVTHYPGLTWTDVQEWDKMVNFKIISIYSYNKYK